MKNSTLQPDAFYPRFLATLASVIALVALAAIALLRGAVPGALESVTSGNTPLILIVSGAVVVGIA
ncbi:MAG: hypothetical protein U9R15_14750, partial [Chloroflexota bacterium]|nr:hypothetical protein [Chloroflexota bacterium]